MLRSLWAVVLELCEKFWDVLSHGDIQVPTDTIRGVACTVVPIERDPTKKVSFPVFFNFIPVARDFVVTF